MSLTRHIRKGVYIRRNIALDLFIGYSSWLRAMSQNRETTKENTVMFERNYSFFNHCLLSCRYVMFQKQ